MHRMLTSCEITLPIVQLSVLSAGAILWCACMACGGQSGGAGAGGYDRRLHVRFGYGFDCDTMQGGQNMFQILRNNSVVQNPVAQEIQEQVANEGEEMNILLTSLLDGGTD